MSESRSQRRQHRSIEEDAKHMGIVEQKIALVLEKSYEILDDRTKAAMAENPGTTMAIEGDNCVFTAAGQVYCVVDRQWLLDDNDLSLPDLELVNGYVPDTLEGFEA